MRPAKCVLRHSSLQRSCLFFTPTWPTYVLPDAGCGVPVDPEHPGVTVVVADTFDAIVRDAAGVPVLVVAWSPDQVLAERGDW